MNQTTSAYRSRYWMKVIQDCCKSGISKKQWLAERNISQASFYYWQKRLRESMFDMDSSEISTLIVPLEQPLSNPHADASAVIIKKDVRIEISDSISDELLMKIMKVL